MGLCFDSLFTQRGTTSIHGCPKGVPNGLLQLRGPSIKGKFFVLFFGLPRRRLRVSSVNANNKSSRLSQLRVHGVPSLMSVLFLKESNGTPIQATTTFSHTPKFSFLFLLARRLQVVFRNFRVLNAPRRLSSRVNFRKKPIRLTVRVLRF